MIIMLSFKTPDVIDQLQDIHTEEEMEEAKDKLAKWIEYGENLTVEFDTDKGTARVLEV